MVSASSGHTWSLYLYMHRPILCKAMFLSGLILIICHFKDNISHHT